MKLLLILRTVRHLKPSQVLARVAFTLRRPAPDLRPPPPRRVPAGVWLSPPGRPACQTGPDRFRLLGEERAIATAVDWDRAEWPKLWRYHLHYHDDLIATGAVDRAAWHAAFVRRWIAENPPVGGSGWEPYPVSRRLVNWVARQIGHGDLPDGGIESLAVQARWLRRRLEHHLLANHLMVNAKALLVAGLFFAGPEAEAWLAEGLRLFTRELAEQVLADGGHYERSPMYHALALEDLLLVIGMCRHYGHRHPPDWEQVAARMVRWLATMSHPDGRIALFNDAAFDQALEPAALAEWARALGIPVEVGEPAPLVHLAASGYARLELGPAALLVDAADLGPDYQPGHGHADTLGCELSLDGQRVVVDSGTSQYGLGPERLRQRGTAAHNTVVVDGADSSEIWGGFRVARRARVHEIATAVGADHVEVSAAHDGYTRLRGVGRHHRRYRLDAAGLTISDELRGRGRHAVEVPFHLHPTVTAAMGGSATAVLHAARAIRVELDPALRWSVEPSTWHPSFGTVQASSRLVGRGEVELPARWSMRLSW